MGLFDTYFFLGKKSGAKTEKKEYINNSKYEHYIHLPYSDELIAYGVYNEIKSNDLTQIFENEYKKVNEYIYEIIENEREKYDKQHKPFSIASYFKKPQCRIDYNEKIDLLED